jgi:hypothetical protein
MLRKYHGKYDVKRVFTDGNEVSVWYDLDRTVAKVFMASCYHVKDRRILSIQTKFDPIAFGPPPQKVILGINHKYRLNSLEINKLASIHAGNRCEL